MGKMENTGIWEKIQKNVQETERLMGQKKYNLSMIKARQTVEYMVKLQCDKAGIVESRKFDTPKPHKAHSVLFFCQFFKYCIA